MNFSKSCVVLYVMILFTCTQEESSEFAGLINEDEDPYAFLDSNARTESSQDAENTSTDSSNYFGSEFRNITRWGRVEFAQKQYKVRELQTTELLDIIARSGEAPEEKVFYPSDVQIGNLIHKDDSSFVEKKSYQIIEQFFQDMQNKKLKENLKKIAVPSEVSLIIQQLETIFNIDIKIKELRIGKIDLIDNDSISCLVRVISTHELGEGRAEMRFYIIRYKGEWLIQALEGDLDELKENYVPKGQFTPQGTTGITQGF